MIKPKTNSIILLCKNYDNKLEEIEFTNQDIKDIIYNLNLNSNDDVTNYIISIGMTESSIPIFLTKLIEIKKELAIEQKERISKIKKIKFIVNKYLK
jgi:hypothetical protein